MKIVKENKDTCIIVAPQYLAKLIGSIFFIGGCLAFIYLYFPFHIHCDIKQPDVAKRCRLSHSVLPDILISQNLDDVYKATVLRRKSRNNSKVNYLIRLYTSTGKYLVYTAVSPGEALVRARVRAINQYILYSSQPQFIIHTIYPWYLLAFISIFPIVGLLVVISSRTTRLEIDVLSNRIKLTRGGFHRREKETYRLDELKSIAIDEDISAKGKVGYQVQLHFVDGTMVPINTVYDNFRGSKDKVVAVLKNYTRDHGDQR